MLGRQIIIEIYNIENYDLLEKVDYIKPLMEAVINQCDLNIVGEVKHQFFPIGATILYLLQESHFCIHTYPEMKACSIDLYTCNFTTDLERVCDIVYDFFNKNCIILKRILER